MGASRAKFVMAWMSDLAHMKAAGALVIQTGCPCGHYTEVDLDKMAALLRGWDMTLWDARPPCDRCGGRQHFMASPRRGTPMRPLISFPPDDIRPLPPQAWMPGWTGRR